MAARGLIEGVVRLEYTRLYGWTRVYALPSFAGPMVQEALMQLLFCAATGGQTTEGPYAYLVDAVHGQLVAHHKGDKFYLPWPDDPPVPVPSDDEYYELCLVFALIQAVIPYGWVSLGDLHSLMQHLRQAYGFTAVSSVSTRPHAAGTIGAKVEERLLEDINQLLTVRGDLYAAALNVAARERARGLEWTARVPAQRRP